MKIDITFGGTSYHVDLNKPIADLSMPVSDQARAWYIDAPTFQPVVLGDWKGSVELGGSVNFFNVQFNPHAHGTNTETAGHITTERHSIHKHFRDPFTLCLMLIPEVKDGMVPFSNFEKSWKEAEKAGGTKGIKSVIFKTDCGDAPKTRNYSNTDWPFLDERIGQFLREQGIDHLIVDQPSVDREEDSGALACHHAFWGPTPEKTLHRTITELAHIPDHVVTGNYLLNLQVAPLENDAAPSRPLLYELR